MPDDIPKDLNILFLESDAMRAAYNAAEGQGDPEAARALVQQVFVSWRPIDFEGRLTLCAMARVIGEDLSPFFPQGPVDKPWERRCFETIGRAWATWARDPSDPQAAAMIAQLRAEQTSRESVEGSEAQRRASAVHLMALYFWAAAVEKLAQGDPAEAKRFWKRAIDVGSSHGTPSHPAVQWTYAASFL